MYDHNIFLPYLVYSNFKIYSLFIIMVYHLEKKSYAKKKCLRIILLTRILYLELFCRSGYKKDAFLDFGWNYYFYRYLMRQKKVHKFLSSNKLSERFVLRSLVHILLSYSVTVWTHITANLYCISLSKREKCA